MTIAMLTLSTPSSGRAARRRAAANVELDDPAVKQRHQRMRGGMLCLTVAYALIGARAGMPRGADAYMRPLKSMRFLAIRGVS